MKTETKIRIQNNLLFRWLRLYQEGLRVESYFLNHGMSRIAVYGYTKLTECLIYELHHSSITLQYVIDREGSSGRMIEFPIIKPTEIICQKLYELDAIIVMPVDEIDIIKNECGITEGIKIIQFEDVLYEI